MTDLDTGPTPPVVSPSQASDRAQIARWAVLAMTVLGAVLRYVVARQDLFADELATYWVISTRGPWDVVKTVATTAEISPPLSFVLSWLTTRIGLSPELVRLPALLAGIGTVPLVYAVGVRTVGRGAALLAAALTTLSPFMIFYSAEARGYGVLMAFTLLSTLALLRAIDDNQTIWWIAYALFTCLTAYTHYTAVFVLGGQFVWAFVVHAPARRRLVLATVSAALLYAPWLPSVKGDLDSPTTKILSSLSPFTLEGVRLSLGHSTLGYPFAVPGARLSDVPGVPGFLLLGLSLAAGVYGLFTMRGRLGRWFAVSQHRIVLVFVLALTTPVGLALQSAVGNNVFSTRSLATSVPYLALTVSAFVTVGRTPLRVAASALAVAAFAYGAAHVVSSSDFRRPPYSDLSGFFDAHPGGVVINAASLTPGPLTNFELEGSTPADQVFRLTVPEQKTTPFGLRDVYPDVTDIAQRSIDAADGGPITLVTFVPAFGPAAEFVDLLPDDYRLTDSKTISGLIDVEAQVYERTGTG